MTYFFNFELHILTVYAFSVAHTVPPGSTVGTCSYMWELVPVLMTTPISSSPHTRLLPGSSLSVFPTVISGTTGSALRVCWRLWHQYLPIRQGFPIL